MSNGVGKELYDDTAKFGLVMAFLGAIIATIIGVLFIVDGTPHPISGQSTSDESLCNNCNECGSNNQQKCNITGFTVWYDPNNKGNSQLSSDSTHVLGWIGIVFGLFLLIVGWVSYYLKRRYKAYAAIGGVSSAIGGGQTIFGK